ncbi:trypsin-like peptidase domain-containing protein [Streptomyces sp. NPDC048448]|uniref:trypsin-like peptidase domain-containing protein n=1 Tax=Streptomyces sp. NPDC048448 TaxID=3365554 RepID=UPI00371C3E0A
MNAIPGTGPRPGADGWVAAVHLTEFDDEPLGSGFLIDEHRVLTCAHVACPPWDKGKPLWVAFPKSEQLMHHRIAVSDVVAPQPEQMRRRQDVAVLVLAESAGSQAAARLRHPLPDQLIGESWWSFGFPDGDPFGNSANGAVGESLTYGWIRLDTESRYPVQSGYSGAALWSPTYQAVVGLVGQARAANGDARALTLHQVERCLPEQKVGLLTDWSAEAAGETALAAWGWSLDDDLEAGRHWKPRARGVSTDAERGFRFRGRTTALTAVVDWLTGESTSRRVLVLTGSPGVGKSAVLGRIVTSADAGVVASLPPEDDAVRAPVGSVACAVHAKGKTALEVAQEIARAASAAPPTAPEDLAAVLRTALTERGADEDGRPFSVVIDALDEATTPEQARLIVRHIALPLAETCTDLRVRVLVGSRRRDDAGDLLRVFGPATRIVDLDAPAYFDRADLVSYAMATLQLLGDERPGSPYTDDAAALPVATRIAELADANFLVAGLTARAHGFHDDVAAEPADISFDPTVAAALDDYMARLPPVDGVPAADVLSALAYAEAPGLPLSLWSTATRALTGTAPSESRLATFARSAAANFLVEASTSEQHTGCFRLFHQALDDALQQGRARTRPTAADERNIARAFLAHGQEVGWDQAPPYLLRSLPRHAERGGVMDELLDDERYPLHADLRRLIAAAGAVQGPARARGRLLHQTPQALGRSPARRAALFSVTEAQENLGDTYRRLAADSPYRAAWATVAPRAEEAVLEGHSGEIVALCTIGTPPYTQLVSGGADGTVRFWDPFTSRTTRVLTKKDAIGNVMCAIVDGDRRWLAVASGDDVSLWGDSERRGFGRLRGHDSRINDMCVLETHEGPRLATASSDKTVRVWNPFIRRVDRVLQGHTDWVTSVCAARTESGNVLVSGSDDHTIRIWDADGRCLRVLSGHTDSVNAVCAAHMDGVTRVISAGSDRTIRVWDLAEGRCLQVIRLPYAVINLRAVQAAGRTLLATTNDNVVALWDPLTGAEDQSLNGHIDAVSTLCVLDFDGRTLIASGGEDHTIRLWDPAKPPADRATAVRAVCAVPTDERPLVAYAGDEGTVWLRDIADGTTRGKMGREPDWIRALSVVDLDREVRIAGGGDGSLTLWDPTGHATPLSLRLSRAVYAACQVPFRGEPMVATTGADGVVQLWDPWLLRPVRALPGHSNGYALCGLDLDGRSLIATAETGIHGGIWLWDPRMDKPWQVASGCFTTDVYALCAVPANGRVALASADAKGAVTVWDPRTGTVVAETNGHQTAANALTTVDLGGRVLLASAGTDRTVRLWNPSTGATVEEIPVRHPAYALTWTGGRIVVGLEQGVLALSLDGLRPRT